MKKIMKGGGNEVTLIIAALFICLIIGGVVFAVSQSDDLEDCSKSDTTALTDKCKCGDDECDKDKYCYSDGTCNDGAKPPSPGASPGGTCSDDAITTESECVSPNTWTPDAAGPPGPPPPSGDPPCYLNSQCELLDRGWTCLDTTTITPQGFYTKEGGDPQDDDYCNECPESSGIINKGGIGIESCVCNDGYYLDTSTNTCAQCGSDKIRQVDTDGTSGECVCDIGAGYMPDPSNPENCILNPDRLDWGLEDDQAGFTSSQPMDYDLSTHPEYKSMENLIMDNYPNCLKNDTCTISNSKLLEIYRLFNYSENSQIPQVSSDPSAIGNCPEGRVLTRNGNLLSCVESECLLSGGMTDASGSHSGEDYNKIPGVGCIDSASLRGLFTLTANGSDITLKQSDETTPTAPGVVKNALIDLCSDGKTCNTGSEESCNGISTLVSGDPDDRKIRFTPIGGKCSCPPIRRNRIVDGDTCEHNCHEDPCITTHDGKTIAEITGDGHREGDCDCSQYCINGFSADPQTGECTIDSGITRDNPNADNGEGLCFHGSRYNRSWNYTDWNDSATGGGVQGSIKLENGKYLNRSYKTSPGSDWVHECLLPEDETATNGLNYEYNPFTRYKCKINQYFDVENEICENIPQSCAERTREGANDAEKFIGYYFDYSPQCSFKGGKKEDDQDNEKDPSAPVGTNACCLSCADQTSHPSRDLIENSEYNNIQMKEYLGGTGTGTGTGYNTRPINYQMSTSGESSSDTNPLSGETDIRQMKKNLFVCQKTNFTDNSGIRWGTGDIGMPTTSSYAEANIIGTDINQDNCKYSTSNIDGPLNTTCQSTFKYFDSSDRTLLSERYVWMREGDNYKFSADIGEDVGYNVDTPGNGRCGTSNGKVSTEVPCVGVCSEDYHGDHCPGGDPFACAMNWANTNLCTKIGQPIREEHGIDCDGILINDGGGCDDYDDSSNLGAHEDNTRTGLTYSKTNSDGVGRWVQNDNQWNTNTSARAFHNCKATFSNIKGGNSQTGYCFAEVAYSDDNDDSNKDGVARITRYIP